MRTYYLWVVCELVRGWWLPTSAAEFTREDGRKTFAKERKAFPKKKLKLRKYAPVWD
jgi:hypothetical protein